MGPGRKVIRVSVVIPVHNGVEHVGEAIRSALGQTQRPYECVVVDDGSVDDTASVLATFGSAITVVRQAWAGVAAARNAGFRAAGGDAFALLDADDVWLPQKLERQMALLAEHPGQAAVCSGYLMTDRFLAPQRAVCFERGPLPMLPAVLLEGPGVGFSFTGVITREGATRTGPFDERLSTSADLEYSWRVARRVGLLSTGDALALYRQHDGGQMHRDLGRLEHDMALVLDGVERDGVAAATVRRGRANVETYLGFRQLLDGELLTAAGHLRRAAGLDAKRIVRHPVGAMDRRVRQLLAGRRALHPSLAQAPLSLPA